VTLPDGTDLFYVINVYADSIGDGKKNNKKATLSWDTPADDTGVILEYEAPVVEDWPSVTSVSVTPTPGESGTTIDVSADIIDQNGIGVAEAYLTYPDGTPWQTLILVQNGNTWSSSFTAIFSPSGTYGVAIYAEDTRGNINDSESGSFTPYLALSDRAGITIDGSFGDWENSTNITDAQGDSGSGGGGNGDYDEKGRINGSTIFEDEEIIIGEIEGIFIYEWNDTNKSYY
jgi:hypothetical protein